MAHERHRIRKLVAWIGHGRGTRYIENEEGAHDSERSLLVEDFHWFEGSHAPVRGRESLVVHYRRRCRGWGDVDRHLV